MAAGSATSEHGSPILPFEVRPPLDRETAPPSTLPGVSVERGCSTERLFRLLDGRWVVVEGRHWRTEVFSVADEVGSRWIQVGLHGPTEHMLTLRTSPTDSLDRLLRMLTSWLTNAGRSPSILTVA
jgi:hypothetical protein